jgi:hypothetical protein
MAMASASVPVVEPPPGRVSISEKLKPICETEEPYPSLTYTRAIIDISAWKARLAAIANTNIWKEHDIQSPSSVKITRPAHDAWGIEKIVFCFCDDFLQKVLLLPHYAEPEWRDLIMPVYEAIGVDESRVIRCLLARMPAGVEIPVHHDTGQT